MDARRNSFAIGALAEDHLAPAAAIDHVTDRIEKLNATLARRIYRFIDTSADS